MIETFTIVCKKEDNIRDHVLKEMGALPSTNISFWRVKRGNRALLPVRNYSVETMKNVIGRRGALYIKINPEKNSGLEVSKLTGNM